MRDIVDDMNVFIFGERRENMGRANAVRKMPASLKQEMLDAIAERIPPYLQGRVFPTEIATTFNYVLWDEFELERRADGGIFSLRPVFVGEYFVDPANPSQTRVFSHHGSEACSPIPITRGVIGRAIRTGKDQYVPDVTKDTNHVGCDPNMQGSELVLLAWSRPYSSTNPYGQGYVGKRVPLGVLDLDFNIKKALNRRERSQLKKIWEAVSPNIFPGEAQYRPSSEMAIR